MDMFRSLSVWVRYISTVLGLVAYFLNFFQVTAFQVSIWPQNACTVIVSFEMLVEYALGFGQLSNAHIYFAGR
jgi:hypothetical protein